MSEKQIRTKNGITVLKEVVTEGLPMPAIRFAFRSDRSDDAAIRLIDTLPPEIDIEDIGFHKDYDRENWRTDGDRKLAYERVIGPDDRVLTVYFVRNEDIDLSEFELEPAFEHVVPVDEDAETSEESIPMFRGSASADTPIGDDMTVSTGDRADIGSSLSVEESPATEPLQLNDPEKTDPEEPLEASPTEPLTLNEPADDEEDAAKDVDDEPAPSPSGDEPLELNDPTEPPDGSDMVTDMAVSGNDSAPAQPSRQPGNEAETEAGHDGPEPSVEPRMEIEATEPVATNGNGNEEGSNLDEAEISEFIESRLEEKLEDTDELIETTIQEQIDETLDEEVIDSLFEEFESIVERAVEERVDEVVQDRFEDTIDERVSEAFEERPDPAESDGSIVARLEEELADNGEEFAEFIGETLAGDLVPKHLEARISRVEGQFNELSAYTDALREFIDEHGAGRELLEEIESRMDRIESTTDAVDSTQDELRAELEAVEKELDELDVLEAQIQETHELLDEHEGQVDSMVSRIDAIDGRMTQLADRMTDISSSTDELWYHRNKLIESFEEAAEKLAEPIENED